MLRKDRITPATDGHPQARKLLGAIGEHQAESDVLDELQRRAFIMDTQAWQTSETAITLFLQVLNTIDHDVVIPSPSYLALEQAACGSLPAPTPDARSRGLAVPCAP